jgi:hypothetical protein
MVERLRTAIRRQMEREIRAPFEGRVEIEALSDEETLRGHFRRWIVSAENQRIEERPDHPGLRLREVGFDLDNVTVNPYRLGEEQELEILAVDELTPRVRLLEADVNAWLDQGPRAPRIRVEFQNGVLRVRAERSGMPRIEVALRPEIFEAQNLRVRFEALRVAGVRLPTFPLAAVMSAYNPILKEMPCRIALAHLQCDRGEWTINELEGTRANGLQSQATSQRNP